MLSNFKSQTKQLKDPDNWLHDFKKRWGLRKFRSNEEAGDGDEQVVQRYLPGILDKLATFEPSEFFNADEFGLLYRMAPDTTVATDSIPGRKKAKEIISVL